MKPAGRKAHVMERLGAIYVHRASRRRRMPRLSVNESQATGIAQSLANLNLMPDADKIFRGRNAKVFGIEVVW